MRDKIVESALEDMGLYVRPFTLTREHYILAENVFTEEDLEKLLELAVTDGDDRDNALDEKRAMPLRTRAVKASAAGRGRPDPVRRAMLRALAQKGFLVHGKYYPNGDKALIRAWQRFKEKGRRVSKQRMKKVLKKGPPR